MFSVHTWKHHRAEKAEVCRKLRLHQQALHDLINETRLLGQFLISFLTTCNPNKFMYVYTLWVLHFHKRKTENTFCFSSLGKAVIR